MKNARTTLIAAAIAGTLVTTSPAGIANADDAGLDPNAAAGPDAVGFDPNLPPAPDAAPVDTPPAPEDAGFDPNLPPPLAPDFLSPPAEEAPPVPVAYSVNWDAIAQCESGGNWSINTGNRLLRRPAVHRRHLACQRWLGVRGQREPGGADPGG